MLTDDLASSVSLLPLRILFVTARYSPHVGGIETHTREVARRIAAAGNDVTILTTDPDGCLPAAERLEDLQVLRVRAWPRKRDYYFAPGIYRMIMRGDWDVIHCQGYRNLVSPLTMLAATRSRIPYVVTFHSGGHSSRFRNVLRGTQRAVLRPLLARAERLVAVSTFEAEFFRDHLHLPEDRFAVIPNGCDLPAVEAPAPAKNGDTLIVSVGRLERFKGHHRLIAALPKVVEQRPDAHLRIVGSGSYGRTLERMAADLGVADRVEIRGVSATDRKEMARILSQASLVTLLSDYEAHPIAVIEALALRRPVLVTYAAGLAELADRGLVRAVAPHSTADEVAEAVLYNLDHPLAPREVTLPTWDQCTADLLALYHTVIRRTPCVS